MTTRFQKSSCTLISRTIWHNSVQEDNGLFFSYLMEQINILCEKNAKLLALTFILYILL